MEPFKQAIVIVNVVVISTFNFANEVQYYGKNIIVLGQDELTGFGINITTLSRDIVV